jgi:hypothetical protein
MSKIAVVVDVEEFVLQFKDRVIAALSEYYTLPNSDLLDDWFNYGFGNACSNMIMLYPSSGEHRISFLNVYNQFELELMTFVRDNITERTIQAMREFGLIRTLFTGKELYIITCNPIQ